MGPSLRNALNALTVFVALLAFAPRARAEDTAPELPLAGTSAAANALVGRNVLRIDVVYDPPLWSAPVTLSGVQVGQTFTPELARRALDELADSGRFGELRAEVEPLGNGVLLRLRVVARRVIASVRISGAPNADELLRTANVRANAEVTARELPEMVSRIERELGRRGYPRARVHVETFDTDDPLGIVLSLQVALDRPACVGERRFFVWPDPNTPGLSTLLGGYAVDRGDRADQESIETADRELEEKLRRNGYYEARVEHTLEDAPRGPHLNVRVYAGARVVLRFEGNRRFDTAELEAALKIEESSDRAPLSLAERVRAFYVERGFLDASVEPKLEGQRGDAVRALTFRIREGFPVRVSARQYPCLDDKRARRAGSEIDSFLSELPGGTLIGPVDPRTVDALFGPKSNATGQRPPPYALNPWSVYSPEVYDRAVDHLKELFHSEGYLSATVGPVVVERRRCDVRSPAGACIPVGPRKRPPIACRYDPIGLPLEEPSVPGGFSCTEDPAHGVHCEPDVVLSIPIKLGPRSFLSSIRLEGNLSLSSEELVRASELVQGTPVSQIELERARRRLVDRYAEEGFAFAEVESSLEFSPDHTQATVVFTISERKQVRVSRIVVRGARMTSESLVRSRTALTVGDIYRRSLIRKTEERLATLGVFSSVAVELEDPYVPASEKVVVITLQERKPQSVDALFGFSSGEGFRTGFEYRHLNLGGQAVRFTLHIQAGVLPLPFILEADVRRKYSELALDERLERANTATLEFPETGLGPLFRLSLEGVDVRHNARDYGLNKDAGIATLFFLPQRGLSFQLSGSLERNNASIFGTNDKNALETYIQNHQNLRSVFRVPQGPTFVVAQRIGTTWDRRDKPLDATAGTLVSVDVEHVAARPLGAEAAAAMTAPAEAFQPAYSNFLRYTNRVAGYVRLSERGDALALSFRWGFNQQLRSNSRTYPDRLFFMGGVDTVRGFLQDSMVPEDVAQKLLDPNSGLDISRVLIRGGDVFVNPRVELRIPLTDSMQTALFLDSGNVWADPKNLNPLRLRYAVGSGIRIVTPIGPLVFDYGFNIERVLDAIDPRRAHQRYWEDIGAFHFSIGLF